MLIDLTHIIRENMPVYPGTPAPAFSPAATLAHDGFCETNLALASHTGTHMDAPAHLLPERRGLDEMDISRFCGTAAVIDCTGVNTITMAQLTPLLALTDRVEYLLFRTGWDQYWRDDAYFAGFPVMDADVARYCARTRKKGVGIDAISVDATQSVALENHRILLEADVLIVENLRGLDRLGSDHFRFYALPLLYEQADGAPVRAMAELR